MTLGHVEPSPTPEAADMIGGVHHPPRVGYDPHNPKFRALVWFGVWFVVVIAVVLVITWFVYSGIRQAVEQSGKAPRSALAVDRPPPPEPRLQPSPAHDQLPQVDLRAMLKAENAEFARRGWQIDDHTGQPVIPAGLVQRIAQQSAPGVVPPNVQPSIPAAPNIAPAGPTTRPGQQ